MQTVMIMTRLSWDLDWSESSCDAQPHCWFCHIATFYLISEVLISKMFECKVVNIILPISFNICFGCSKEPSQWDGSFEYSQHMFWLRNKKIIFWYALLTTLIESSNQSVLNISYLENCIFLTIKIFNTKYTYKLISIFSCLFLKWHFLLPYLMGSNEFHL